MRKLSFQQIILKLQQFWEKYGCSILQPYTSEMGAGTFHPATILYCLGPNPWNVAYIQPSCRPTDSRYAEHPNRLQHYYQFQVLLKPSPDNIQELYLNSLKKLGINSYINDIRFVEDDWESPTLGASGLGWEVWCNGMEISQFTYMQQLGGIDCFPIAGEITYGLERIALYIQGVSSIREVNWNGQKGTKALTYAQIDFEAERQFSKFNLELADVEMLVRHFFDFEKQCKQLLLANLPIPAYDYCIKANHSFNLLNARGVISVTERASYIIRLRTLAKMICEKWLKIQGHVV